ncbi:MAG: hypothetical protein ABI605_09475 [Rhizobacter sp.]
MFSEINEEFIIRLSVPQDAQNIADLHRRCLPGTHPEYTVGTRPTSQNDATLLACSPTGELIAKTVLGVARSAQELSAHLGVPVSIGAHQLPVLTTANTCSSDGASYLAALLGAVLELALRLKINGAPVAFHMCTFNARSVACRTQFEELGYVIRTSQGAAGIKATAQLNRRQFDAAFIRLTYDMFERKVPWHSYVGASAFEHLLEDA